MPAKNVVLALSAGALVVASAAVATRAQAPAPHAAMAGPGAPTKAVAVLQPTKGSKVEGTVTFTAVQGGVRVQATVNGLADGPHGFHVHEFGDTRSPDGTSAGGHFNPMKEPHGPPTSPMRHVGDLGNIESKDGVATLDLIDPALAFIGANSILGRGLVVHEKADDLKTQPTGNAGGRLAVGVIGVANPAPPAAAKPATPK